MITLVEEEEETGSAASKQIAVGDPLKLTQQCQQMGRESIRGREEREQERRREGASVWKKRTHEKVMRRRGREGRQFGISMLRQQLRKEGWRRDETEVLNA